MIISVASASEVVAHTVTHTGLLQDPTFWVGISFCLVVLALAKPVGKILGTELQARASGIENKLEEAKKLRNDAQTLLLEYQKKQQEAQQEAEDMLLKAQENAEKITAEAQKNFEDSLKKREEIALARLERSADQALEEVRNMAVSISISSVEQILTDVLKGDVDRKLLEQTIDSLPDFLSKQRL